MRTWTTLPLSQIYIAIYVRDMHEMHIVMYPDCQKKLSDLL